MMQSSKSDPRLPKWKCSCGLKNSSYASRCTACRKPKVVNGKA